VRVIEKNGTRCVLELADGVDDQAVLHTALAAGPVHEFSRQRPSLTELFRNVVTTKGRSA
jgi:ABC-2 type transport system ATP-binding protein